MFSLGLVAFGARSIGGELHFSQAQAWSGTDSLQAFAASNEAYKAMPLSSRNRIQLVLSLKVLLDSNKKASVDPAAADRAYEIAASASPNHPVVMIARLEYLLNSGRWKSSNQAESIVGGLIGHARSYPQTWMLAAAYFSVSGQNDKAALALVSGMNAGANLADMQKIASQINMEITEQ